MSAIVHGVSLDVSADNGGSLMSLNNDDINRGCASSGVSCKSRKGGGSGSNGCPIRSRGAACSSVTQAGYADSDGRIDLNEVKLWVATPKQVLCATMQTWAVALDWKNNCFLSPPFFLPISFELKFLLLGKKYAIGRVCNPQYRTYHCYLSQ
jgi:hypothetical protein